MINSKLLIAAIVGATTLLPIAASTSHAARVFVEIGDRPYYNRGPYYWERGRRWVWVPGHWERHRHHRVWIHGHYARVR